ncbi:MAG: membrane protein insertion efficiency factor YidD [Patescibacteria group bacterium]
MKAPLIFLIRFYQKILSPETGVLLRLFGRNKKVCVFYPSCSEYAIASIEKHGALKGGWYSFARILRCHPWQEPKIDLIK